MIPSGEGEITSLLNEPLVSGLQRIVARVHLYMPLSLLSSQFETLEESGPDENPITVVVHGSIPETVVEILQRLAIRGA